MEAPNVHALVPERHYLDRRALKIAAEADDKSPDDLMRTRDVAEWLAMSEYWLVMGRSAGYGPPWIKLGPKVVRYRRSDVVEWLEERAKLSVRIKPRRQRVKLVEA